MVRPAAVALADEVKTGCFPLILSNGWTQPKPTQSANGTVIAIVQYPDGTGAVSIAVTHAPLPARDPATLTVDNMKTGGFTVSARETKIPPPSKRNVAPRILQKFPILSDA